METATLINGGCSNCLFPEESKVANLNSTYNNMISFDTLEDGLPFWAFPMTSRIELPETPTHGMQEFLSRSQSMAATDDTRALVPLPPTSDRQRVAGGTSDNVEDLGMHFSFYSAINSEFIMDNTRAASDLSPLIPKRKCSLLDNESYSPSGESAHSTPRKLEELKNWLWLQQETSTEVDMGGCLHVKWLDKSLVTFRSFLRRTSVKRWFKDAKERKKEKMLLHNAHVHAALSVAGVAAAIAAVAAESAASATNERESKTGVAVASAAALVAAKCAEMAEDMGADHTEVASVVNSAKHVRTTADILSLTASAATSLQGAATLTSKPQREARIHAAVSPCERNSSPNSMALSASSMFYDSEAECTYSQELLARGCDFLVRFRNGKLHLRSVSIFLDTHKQVVVKLQNRHMAGAFSKTELRVVLDILRDIPAWPGRSLLHDGEQQCYFGLQTSHGNLEFECKSDMDHQLWTDGVSHLLCLANQHKQK